MISSPLADSMSTSATADIDKDLAALAESMRVLDFRRNCEAESMRVLRSRRNALLPISRLPAEILEIVFQFFEEEKRFDESSNNDVPACLAVTHVCRHWRIVALECLTLWTFICSSSPRCLGIMLERSKDAPLVVTYKTQVSLQDCLEPVLSHLPRIKVLRFSSPSSDVEHVIRLLSSQPAPLLEVFEFYNLRPFHDIDPTSRLISGNIFQDRAPRLRSVELGMFSLDWTAHIFSGLRTLRIRRTTSYPTTLSELLSALRRMPALEHLTLEKLPIISDGTELRDEVSLARLKSIALGSASIQTATSLFERLAIPVNAKIALQLTEISGLEDFSRLFFFMDRYPDKTGSVFRSMRAIDFSIPSFCVQFSTSTVMNPPNTWDTLDDDIRLSIQFTYERWDQVEPRIIFDICRLVTHNKIQKFSYGSDFHHPKKDFWRAVSTFLPEVETIHINSTFIGSFIDALKIDEGEQESDIPYPSLRALEVEAAPFEDEEPEKLRDVMKTRAQHGVCIQALRLAQCEQLSADQVQGFKEVVASVDWDIEQPEYVDMIQYDHYYWAPRFGFDTW